MNPSIRATGLLVISSAFASVAHAQPESAKFGFIAPANARLELVKEQRTIPWKKGVCEPWFGIFLSFPPSQEHTVEFRAYSQDRSSGEYREVQKDPIWSVVEAAILTAENIDFEPGKYRFTAAIDGDEPLAFDFEVTPFENKKGEPCPAPSRQESKEFLRAQRGD
ncbi:MAG: hypothetical protein AB7E72_03980 [Lysobacterales bacterium]